MRERKTVDLENIKCIKDEDGKLLVGEAKIKDKLQNYVYKLFNGERIENS